MCSSLYLSLTLSIVNRILPSNPFVLIEYFTYLIKTKLIIRSDLSEQSLTLPLWQSVFLTLFCHLWQEITVFTSTPNLSLEYYFLCKSFTFAWWDWGERITFNAFLVSHISRSAPPFVASRAVLLISESLNSEAQNTGPESPMQFTRNIWVSRQQAETSNG